MDVVHKVYMYNSYRFQTAEFPIASSVQHAKGTDSHDEQESYCYSNGEDDDETLCCVCRQ